jgi:hypothetical protein
LPLTDLTFLKEGAGWPPKGEKKRLERYEQNRLLWRGEHDRVYGDWWRVLREDKAASLELVFNWHRRISTLWADLLVGEPPRFLAVGVEEQRALDRITGKAENAFVTTLYEVALDVSRYGDGLLKVRLSEDGAEVVGQPPSYWFPVVSPDDLRRARAHVLAWEFEREGKRYLRAEIHERGRIENRLYALEGGRISSRAPLTYASPGRNEIEETGVEDFLVVPVAGLRATDELFGVDDYGDLDSVVQTLEVRAGQVNRILDKHSDPSMYGPPDYAGVDERTGEPRFEAGGRYFEVDEGGTPPGYVTWDGQLDAQFKEIEALLEQLYVISETSPAAFGQLKTGLAESGSALKRLMQAPLAKVARMAMRFEPAARRALRLAAELERANGRETPEIKDVAIQWQDGLPPDPKEQAETEAVRIESGTTSRASAMRRLDGGTQQEAEAELKRAQAEAEVELEVNRPPSRAGFS